MDDTSAITVLSDSVLGAMKTEDNQTGYSYWLRTTSKETNAEILFNGLHK